MNFLVKYLVTAAVLAAAVWFGIPVIKARMESQPATATAPAATTATVPASTPATPRVPADGAAQAATPAPVTTATPAAPAATTPVSAPAPEPVPATAATSAVASEPTRPVQTGPRYNWGVLAEEAQAYNEEGKPRVKLPAGTVVEKIEERKSADGQRLLVCRVLNNRRWERGFVLKAASVVTFDCPFEEAPKEAREKIVRYFQLQGFIATRTAALREDHLKRNPHFTAYRRAAKEYTDFQERAKELTAQRDAAQGAERTRIASQLERMKSEEVQLRSALEKVEVPYKKWKAEHGDGIETVINDEQIGQWNDEIDEIKSDVLEYIPDL